MNNIIDFNNCNDYAVILPDGMILFGIIMVNFLLGVKNNSEHKDKVNQVFIDISKGELNNYILDLGEGFKLEIVKCSQFSQSTNPVICN